MNVLLIALLSFMTGDDNPVALVPATSYRVEQARSEGGNRELLVWSDGTRVHASLSQGENPLGYDSLIGMNGGSIFALNAALKTWYELDSLTPLGLESRYLTPLKKEEARNVQWRMTAIEAPSTEVREYAGELSYEVRGNMQGHRIKVNVSAVIRIITDGTQPRSAWLGRILPLTSYDEVDARLNESEATIEGLPQRMTLEVTRKFAGGEPMKDSMTIVVSDLARTEVTPSMFERPPAYRHQRPIIGAPGV